MSDLQTRLQTALGDAYRIERELGGGGMSHVYLAQETALGRRVVIKVLPPEMAAGVNIERFRREIQLAASLQHPHIVPLHAAAQVGDLFYYTMPLVDGESLRAKLAREGELPVGDTIRIIRNVVDALAYAHAHGVVHRDIKPDNILISGNHAVVTDFGVAKAVSASTGGTSLTSMGLALGTPAYMAPEQAAADPHVDHRADLYAVGATAYEMLCGHPPFSGMSPQQVLAAHVTLAPAPLSSQRASVPPALNELIMRCLEKKPADRVQRAEDLLTQLQAMATPSGGMAPTGATPALTSGAKAAIRRTNPMRVTMMFAAASVAVLGIVFLLRNVLGLPNWVLGAAGVLLLAGLPIMIMTGRRERARLEAAHTGTFMVPPVGVEKLFTWRRAILGGVAAFALLAVIVIGYTVMRVMGIGSVGTLQAKGLLKARQPILLAEFENRSTDSTLGPTLTEAFRVDLSQSQTVKLLDAQAVSDALNRMQKPPGSVLIPALAREVAEREGVPAIVEGQIDPVGKSFVVSAKIVSAKDGAVLTAVRETAAADADLIPALDKLSRALRERIGESLVSIRADEPLAHVTTGSLDALKKYTQALRLSDVGQEEQSVPLYEEAVAMDSGFAMAWRKLGAIYQNMGASNVKVINAIKNAYKYRDRLPELERQATIAYYYNAVDNEPTKVEAAYRAMLAIDPDNTIPLNNLSIVLFDMRRYAEAESLAVRCMDNGVFSNCPFHAIRAQMAQGKMAAADTSLARWQRALPTDPNLGFSRSGMAAVRGDYAAAERISRENKAAHPASLYVQEISDQSLAAFAADQGQLNRALQSLRAAQASAEARALPGDYLSLAANYALVEIRDLNRSAEAIARVNAAMAKHPLSTMDAVDRPYTILASAYAAGGRIEDAQRLMAEYANEVPKDLQKGDFNASAAAGDIAAAQGRPADAIAAYRRMRTQFGCPQCGLFEIATQFQKLGEPDSALVYYEAGLANSGPQRAIFTDPVTLAATYQRLGELYEAKGDRKKAMEYYLKLADLWKNADPELQPIVKDAHARVARLSAEH